MDAHKKIREHISALGDGELASSDLELAAAALRSPDGELAWITYHRIGDALRAEAPPEFSPGFNERLNARLSTEPPPLRRGGTGTVIVAPSAAAPASAGTGAAGAAGAAGATAAASPAPAAGTGNAVTTS